MAYWYCVKHSAVEQGSKLGWFHPGRLGPYPTAADAAAALATIAARDDEQRKADAAWAEHGERS